MNNLSNGTCGTQENLLLLSKNQFSDLILTKVISSYMTSHIFFNLTEGVQYNATLAIRTTQTSTYLCIQTCSFQKSYLLHPQSGSY